MLVTVMFDTVRLFSIVTLVTVIFDTVMLLRTDRLVVIIVLYVLVTLPPPAVATRLEPLLDHVIDAESCMFGVVTLVALTETVVPLEPNAPRYAKAEAESEV